MEHQIMEHPGDLREFIKEIQDVFTRWFADCNDSDRPAIVLAFTLPRDYSVCHWLTNVRRSDGIRILIDTAEKMKEETEILKNRKLN